MSVTDADQLAEAEFRGFFYGEGSIVVTPKKGTGLGTTVYVTVSITQRSDNYEALRWVLHRLGGNLYGPVQSRVDGKKRGTHYRWYIQNREGTERVLLILLAGQMPSVKRREAEIALQVLRTTRVSAPGRLTRYTQPEKDVRARLVAEFSSYRRERKETALNAALNFGRVA